MNKTIDYYNQHAKEFVSGTLNVDMSECRDRFLAYVKPAGKILDAGCGSGRDALVFLNMGYSVDAFDASEEICRMASEVTGIPVECKCFEELEGDSEYDGIWACASLPHVDAALLLDVMQRLANLLKPEGILYASFKEGDNEWEKDGRYFHNMTEDSCRELFENAGLKIMEIFRSFDVREGRANEVWVNAIGKRCEECPSSEFEEELLKDLAQS